MKKRGKITLCIGAAIILCWVLLMGIDCFRLMNSIDSMDSLEKPFITVSERKEESFFDVIYGDVEKIKYTGLGYSIEYEYFKGSYIWDAESGLEKHVENESISIYSVEFRLFDKIIIWDSGIK